MKTLIVTLFLVLASPLFASGAMAQDTENNHENVEITAPVPPPTNLPSLGPAAEDTRPLRPSLNDRAVRNIDQLRIQLNNGRIVELTGIEIPQRAGYADSEEAFAAKQFLDTLFTQETDRDIILYQTPGSGHGRTNRMGHDLGHVVRKNGNIWVQGALISQGLAYARPTPVNPELADKMYGLEDQARAKKLGLWADDSAHRLVTASDTIAPLDRFAVVEGVVRNVAIVNNVTYLNFGPDWRKDFTIGIPSATRQALARSGLDVFKLQGQTLRVRGWLRFYNGPYIELEHPVLLQQVKNEQDSNAKP